MILHEKREQLKKWKSHGFMQSETEIVKTTDGKCKWTGGGIPDVICNCGKEAQDECNGINSKSKSINMNTTENKVGVILGVVMALVGFFTNEEFLTSNAQITPNAAFWIKTVFGAIGVAITAYNGYQWNAKTPS